MMSTAGVWMSSAPTDRRRRSPPLSPRIHASPTMECCTLRSPSSSTTLRTAAPRYRCAFHGSRSSPWNVRYSVTVDVDGKTTSCGTYPTTACSCAPVICRPAAVMTPPLTTPPRRPLSDTRPDRMSSRVDLPAPDGPSTAHSAPPSPSAPVVVPLPASPLTSLKMLLVFPRQSRTVYVTLCHASTVVRCAVHAAEEGGAASASGATGDGVVVGICSSGIDTRLSKSNSSLRATAGSKGSSTAAVGVVPRPLTSPPVHGCLEVEWELGRLRRRGQRHTATRCCRRYHTPVSDAASPTYVSVSVTTHMPTRAATLAWKRARRKPNSCRT